MNRSAHVHVLASIAFLSGALAAAPALHAQAGTQQSVEWVVTGMAAQLYAIVGLSDNGHALSLTRLANVVEGPNQFGATAAIVNAEPYRGRRVRVRALIRTDSATVGGSTWLRIDGGSGSLILENNMSRMLSGTTGWSEQVTTLEVPMAATRIIYGLLLSGGGTLHARDVSIENLAPGTP
jgi:hypothetical protein